MLSIIIYHFKKQAFQHKQFHFVQTNGNLQLKCILNKRIYVRRPSVRWWSEIVYILYRIDDVLRINLSILKARFALKVRILHNIRKVAQSLWGVLLLPHTNTHTHKHIKSPRFGRSQHKHWLFGKHIGGGRQHIDDDVAHNLQSSVEGFFCGSRWMLFLLAGMVLISQQPQMNG